MVTADTIAQKLTIALMPNEIDVKDVSHKHAGHTGWREEEAHILRSPSRRQCLQINPVCKGIEL